MTARLSAATLATLPAGIARPCYDRADLGRGIVHLGLGAFHRAHQAVYTEAALNAGDLRWGITGISLRRADTREALAPQDGLYAVETRGGDGALAVIGALHDIRVGPAEAMTAMLHPQTAIVSLTVTEKAYCRAPASGALDEADPAVRADLAGGAMTVPGLLVSALAARRKAGLPPFTVLCCDNLPRNGRTVHGLLVRFATLLDPDLGAWIEAEVACPDTMVDRIVPATTDADRERVSARLGVADAWPVVAEPFSQWVIEDRFTAGRPAWDAAGALLVRDVASFETMKLRLLNGSHSALAYLGALAGCETVAEAMAAPELAGFVARLMERTQPALIPPEGIDLAAYRADLLERFRNPALRHLTRQIAMDGSQKLPQRLLDPARILLAAGLPIEGHALAVAAWMRFVAQGNVQDPMASEIAAVVAEAGSEPARLAPALLGLGTIFGDLGTHPGFRTAVTGALEKLTRAGARVAASEL